MPRGGPRAQMAEGATYGVVPFVSKRSLGVVSGMVGAGGSIGSVVLQACFFSTGTMEAHQGISYMGIAIMVTPSPSRKFVITPLRNTQDVDGLGLYTFAGIWELRCRLARDGCSVCDILAVCSSLLLENSLLVDYFSFH